MMVWIFAGITLFSVLIATFARHIHHAILALWVAGLGVGGIYLTLGAEFLAIVQWMISTLVTLSFVFFSVVFGEYNAPPSRTFGNGFLLTLLALGVGISFAGVIGLGARDLMVVIPAVETMGNELKVIGRLLTQENLLSLEVLALTLFLTLIGGGVVARLEGSNDS